MGLNFIIDMIWGRLILLSLIKKWPKKQSPDTRGAGKWWLSLCTVAPAAFWKCVFWDTLYIPHNLFFCLSVHLNTRSILPDLISLFMLSLSWSFTNLCYAVKLINYIWDFKGSWLCWKKTEGNNCRSKTTCTTTHSTSPAGSLSPRGLQHTYI